MTAEWLAPAVAFVVLEGALGITTKLALRSISWHQLLIWTAIGYALIAVFLVVATGEMIPFGAGVGWAVLSGIFASFGLLLFFLALERGEASNVVPVTAAYPLVTALLAALVLSEEISPLRGLGTLLVVVGIIELGRA